MQKDFNRINLNALCKKVAWFLVPYLIILTGCLAIKTICTREQIYFAVNSRHAAWADAIAPWFTNLGDGLALVALAIIVAFFSFRKSFLLLTGYGITSLTAQVLKRIFDMPRPYLYFRAEVSKMHLVKGVAMLSYHSFPSGHTVTAFSACITLAYFIKGKYQQVLLLLLAILIGYSRMYLSEHFFEDVTGGSAIGVFVTLFWLYWLDNRPFIHKGKWQGGMIKKTHQ
jgi:membrane-associated phospholipid phosphatase